MIFHLSVTCHGACGRHFPICLLVLERETPLWVPLSDAHSKRGSRRARHILTQGVMPCLQHTPLPLCGWLYIW